MRDVIDDPENKLPALRAAYDHIRVVRGQPPMTDDHWLRRLRMVKSLGLTDELSIEALTVALDKYPEMRSKLEQT